MSDQLTCAELHELAFEYRAGELGEPRRVLVDEHLADCSACSAFVANLEALIDAAASAPEALPDETVDRIWSGLEAQLPAADGPEHPAFGRARRWALLLAPLAAAVAILIWVATSSRPAADWADLPASAGDSVEGAPTAAGGALESPAPEAAMATPTPVPPKPEPEALRHAVLEGHPGVAVFASPGAQWSVIESGDVRIVLESGGLLLEAEPELGEVVVVQAPDRRIEVVGTVFQVVVERGRSTIATAAGAVLVTENDGSTVQIDAGLQLGPDGALTAMDPARLDTVRRHIDLAAHARRLAARRADRREAVLGTTAVSRSSEPAAAPTFLEPEPTDGRGHPDPLGLADHAQREGRYRDAAAILEALVTSDRLSGAQISLARLELARIYETRLEEPERALRHLRRFLLEEPDDPAAASVAREACRLALSLGLTAEDCL